MAKPKPPSPAEERRRRAEAARRGVSLPVVATDPETPADLGTFSEFDASDYTVKSADGRALSVSPLRAVMEEQRRAETHVVTERTRQGVLYGAGLGIEHSVLAMIMNISEEELREHYDTELRTAAPLMMSDIQTNLYNIARDPNHGQSVRAGTYLLGKLGSQLYKEQQRSAQALAVRPDTRTVDVSLLTDEQREALKTILQAAVSLAQGDGMAQREVEMLEAEYDEIEDSGKELL